MNRLTEAPLLAYEQVEREVVARDREMANPYSKDSQVTAIHGARRYLADRITRIAAPHRLLDPDAGPLIAVKLHVLTRKSLGGLHTDLQARAHSLPQRVVADRLEVTLELGELRPMPLASSLEDPNGVAAGEDLQHAFFSQLGRRELG